MLKIGKGVSSLKRTFLYISLLLILALVSQSPAGMPRADAASKVPTASDWLGEWKWNSGSKNDQSTIKVESVKQGKLTFSLDAYHMTSPDNANVGNIDHGVAVLKGNKAVFADGDLDFMLTLTLANGVMNVSATEDVGYFGRGVWVSGTYLKKKPVQQQPVKTDLLLVPGKSVGKIKLGMTQVQVRKLLGKPTKIDGSELSYKSTKNEVVIYLNKKNTVAQIEFTSSSFATADRMTTKNFENYGKKFNKYEFQWRFLQQRYMWKDGGLSFFTFNADVPDDNPEYSRSTRGYVYAGKTMFAEPITGVKWRAV
jgi:hypothetical protein